jgi:hypothetical protein
LIYFIYTKEPIDIIDIKGLRVKYINNSIVIDENLKNKFNLAQRYEETFNIENINQLSTEKFNFIKHINIKVKKHTDV